MFSTSILAVGLDLRGSAADRRTWESAGYFVTSTNSIREAIERFRGGDFDAVVLGNSIPPESRERLAFLIRASGTNIPVIAITGSSSSDSFADAVIDGKPKEVFRKVGEILATESRLSVLRGKHPRGMAGDPRS